MTFVELAQAIDNATAEAHSLSQDVHAAKAAMNELRVAQDQEMLQAQETLHDITEAHTNAIIRVKSLHDDITNLMTLSLGNPINPASKSDADMKAMILKGQAQRNQFKKG